MKQAHTKQAQPRQAQSKQALLRELLGHTLREERTNQRRTLREVSTAARVSLGYLSEIERGQKEASSELLSSICEALGIPLSRVLVKVAARMALLEKPKLQPVAA